MALPTVAELKEHLRVQGAAEDALLGRYLAQAKAAVRGAVRLPLTAVESDVSVVPEPHTVYGARSVLYLPGPVAAAPAPVVLDPEGDAVAAIDYILDRRLYVICAVSPYVFTNGMHHITATIGWSAHPDYEELYEPILSAAIIDTASDLYQRRNPAAQAEGAGGGVYTQWASTQGVPARVLTTLEPMRRVRVR